MYILIIPIHYQAFNSQSISFGFATGMFRIKNFKAFYLPPSANPQPAATTSEPARVTNLVVGQVFKAQVINSPSNSIPLFWKENVPGVINRLI